MQLIDLYKVLDENEELCIYVNNTYNYYFFTYCPEYLLNKTVKKVYKSSTRQYIVVELEDDL